MTARDSDGVLVMGLVLHHCTALGGVRGQQALGAQGTRGGSEPVHKVLKQEPDLPHDKLDNTVPESVNRVGNQTPE